MSEFPALPKIDATYSPTCWDSRFQPSPVPLRSYEMSAFKSFDFFEIFSIAVIVISEFDDFAQFWRVPSPTYCSKIYTVRIILHTLLYTVHKVYRNVIQLGVYRLSPTKIVNYQIDKFRRHQKGHI